MRTAFVAFVVFAVCASARAEITSIVVNSFEDLPDAGIAEIDLPAGT